METFGHTVGKAHFVRCTGADKCSSSAQWLGTGIPVALILPVEVRYRRKGSVVNA